MASKASLLASAIMVSDWSGAALEYAFGRERPVLFVDLPRKVLNDDYEALKLEPLEVSVRTEVGEVVSPDQLEEMPAAIERLCADPAASRQRIVAARERHVFNVGRSAAVGADHLMQVLAEHREDQP
jgi:YidC/Oxa1 family membrane protein insertase